MPIKVFKEIASVPRPSSKEEKIIQYIKKFAGKNNIAFEVDEFNNVLLKKKTANLPALTLQAHTDMVCVKEQDKKIDFEKEGITVLEKNGFLHADKTSLGADNGMGVAMALKLLTEDFPMNVEVLLTSEEETTMAGAYNFDTSKLKSKYMLSLDGSANNKIDISFASSTELKVFLPSVNKLKISQIESAFLSKKLNVFAIEIKGFIGGHSGLDVNKHRGNAFKTALDFFEELENFYFIDINAKSKSNELPTYFNSVFATTSTLKEVNAIVETIFEETFMGQQVPELSINLKEVRLEGLAAIFDSSLLLSFIKKINFGVIDVNDENEVLLSANLYEINLKQNFLKLHLRSNMDERRERYISKLQSLCKVYKCRVEEESHLPGFSISEENNFVKFVKKASKTIFKEEAQIVNIHAGVEVGIFSEKIDGLNVCVIGPQIDFMHSTKERVNIDSVNKTYEWLKLIVKNFK